MSAAARSQVFCRKLSAFASVTKKDLICLFGILLKCFYFFRKTSADCRCEFTLYLIHDEDVEDCSCLMITS